MSTDVALLVRVAASLVAVVLLALVAAHLARRGTGRRGGGDLRVRDRVGLTRDTAAVVLETGGRRLLVGVGPAQVTLLADLGTAEPVVAGAEVIGTGTAPGAGTTATGAVRGAEAPQTVPIEPGTPVRDALASLPRQARTATPSTGTPLLSRRAIRELDRGRRIAVPPTQRGTGSVLDPRTWQQGVEALRDLTARRG